jgi:nitroreductase
MQAYTVIHVAESERKANLAKLCGDQAQIHQSAAFLVFCADLNRCGLAGRLRDSDRLDGGYVEGLLVATVDAALVMQNVAVAAESVGLGICMIGAIRNHPRAVGDLLGLPALSYAVSGLCLGYPAQDPATKPRLPMEAVLHRERYLDESEHGAALESYDHDMIAFYESQDMHPSDPRWTTVTADRAASFHARAELDAFLREQGFLRHGGEDTGPR